MSVNECHQPAGSESDIPSHLRRTRATGIFILGRGCDGGATGRSNVSQRARPGRAAECDFFS